MLKQSLWNDGYLDGCTIENFYCLKSIHLEGLADKREIYFLGENGDGKTLLLQALFLALRKEFLNFANKSVKIDEISKALELLRVDPQPHLEIRRKGPVSEAKQGERMLISDSVYAYGVNRSSSSKDGWEPHGFMTLFDEQQTLRSPVSWLRKLYIREFERKTVISLDTVRGMLAQILDEGLDFKPDGDDIIFFERGSQLPFQHLSEGYRSVMTWVFDLLARLSENQKMVRDVRDYVGIVLIDEVSLHLHPKWEGKMVARLREWFPKIQFVFTTHSPTTIMGASEDAVFYKLYKQDGITQLSEPFNNEDMCSLMANGLVTSPLFGLESARMRAFPTQKVPDTSDSYLHSRIHKAVSAQIKEMATAGQTYLSRQEIDDLVARALDENE